MCYILPGDTISTIMSVMMSLPRREKLYIRNYKECMSDDYYKHMMEIPDIRMPSYVKNGKLIWRTWKDGNPHTYLLSNNTVRTSYPHSNIKKFKFSNIREAMYFVYDGLSCMDHIHTPGEKT